MFGRDKTDDYGSSLQVATSQPVTCCCTTDKVKPFRLALSNLFGFQQQPHREYVINGVEQAQKLHKAGDPQRSGTATARVYQV